MFSFIFVNNGCAQRLDPLHVRVFRHAFPQRSDRGCFDVLGGVKIRLTSRETDHVNAFRPEFACFGGDGKGYRRLNQFGSFCDSCHLSIPYCLNFFTSFVSTLPGTRPETSPPKLTTSFTRRELM